MATKTRDWDIRNYLDEHEVEDFAHEVLSGLRAEPKHLSSKYFYDAKGSQLFEQICAQPEYYPTGIEHSILENMSRYLHEDLRSKDIVELGSGSHHKMNLLLRGMSPKERDTVRYIPFDISEKAVLDSAAALTAIYPELSVFGIVGDFAWHLDYVPTENPNYFFFLGGTIGNMDYNGMVAFLRNIGRSMRGEDRIFVGFDMVKDIAILERAYNDSAGVTAAFNKNILNVVNDRTGSDFDPRLYEHVAFFAADKERIEMHLAARSPHRVLVPQGRGKVEAFALHQGERIHTENSHKFTYAKIRGLAADSGLQVVNRFVDNREWFAVVEFALP